ncbi:hypothetical protein BDK51DRAFT_26892, partial [Blyttiomyces helicus]
MDWKPDVLLAGKTRRGGGGGVRSRDSRRARRQRGATFQPQQAIAKPHEVVAKRGARLLVLLPPVDDRENAQVARLQPLRTILTTTPSRSTSPRPTMTSPSIGPKRGCPPLPTELLLEIFNRLHLTPDILALTRCRAVSIAWRRAADQVLDRAPPKLSDRSRARRAPSSATAIWALLGGEEGGVGLREECGWEDLYRCVEVE